jgi:hypothetical protein
MQCAPSESALISSDNSRRSKDAVPAESSSPSSSIGKFPPEGPSSSQFVYHLSYDGVTFALPPIRQRSSPNGSAAEFHWISSEKRGAARMQCHIISSSEDDSSLLTLASAASSDAEILNPIPSQVQQARRSARVQTAKAMTSDAEDSSREAQNRRSTKRKLCSAPVVQPPAKSKRIPVPKSIQTITTKVVKSIATKVVQLDDTLLVLPPNFSAQGWPEAKSLLIGLMKNTGHRRAFIRTSKSPSSGHSGYWAKVICPECPCFIIGSSTCEGKSWTVNSQSHGTCLSSIPSTLVPPAADPVSHSVIATKNAKLCSCCLMDDRPEPFAQCDGNHFFCSDCFDRLVSSAITGDNAAICISKGCIIPCRWCLPAAINFDMHKYASVLTNTCYNAWMDVSICICSKI